MVTGLYAALFAVLQVKYTLNIVQLRRGKKVSIGDGGHDVLAHKIRAHANFTETVPIALILMGLAELSGSPFWAIHVLGVVLLIGRLIHYVGLTTGRGYGKLRFYGMVLTVIAILLGAFLNLWLALPILTGPNLL